FHLMSFLVWSWLFLQQFFHQNFHSLCRFLVDFFQMIVQFVLRSQCEKMCWIVLLEIIVSHPCVSAVEDRLFCFQIRHQIISHLAVCQFFHVYRSFRCLHLYFASFV